VGKMMVMMPGDERSCHKLKEYHDGAARCGLASPSDRQRRSRRRMRTWIGNDVDPGWKVP
jgi:hypothetical protein